MDADNRQSPWTSIVFVAAWIIGAASALPYAGGWNDGSRLASVESLVDRGTLVIDDSIFVNPRAGANPYPADRADLGENGTLDKLRIHGHYYSDKPALLSLLMAGLYQMIWFLSGMSAVGRLDWFCWTMTAATSGLAYALALVWQLKLGRRAGLTGGWLAAWLGSFALASVALTYTRHVNNHILLLAVMAGLLWQLVQAADAVRAGQPVGLRLFCIGMLAGLGYIIDLGSGPMLLAALFPLILWRTRRPAALVLFMVGLLPWVLAHHAINYQMGGTIKPANAVPEYLAWPGSPFHADNMTGLMRHTPGRFVVYSLALLFGKHGLIVHNLALWLTLPGLWLVRRAWRESSAPEGWFAAAWCAGTFLMYAAFSNNYGGACCSVRWFVPFLAPGYWLLAWSLVRYPGWRGDFLILSGWGLVLSCFMWQGGPWMLRMVPWLWPIQGAALASWAGYRIWFERGEYLSRPSAAPKAP